MTYYEPKITTTEIEIKRKKKWNGEYAPPGWKWYHNIFPSLHKKWTVETELKLISVIDTRCEELLIKAINNEALDP